MNKSRVLTRKDITVNNKPFLKWSTGKVSVYLSNSRTNAPPKIRESLW